ncbi:MAG: helix-hairpin-helix domain-containing protein [Proteobacteria bacterium]|nr:helix-hairpin-helix domain-containing protein [Pseudomonadota bacterium]
MIKKLVAIVLALFAAAAFAASVDVNKASQADLDAVKGIGPAISGKIVEERKKGAFKDWNDLIDRVKGVGEHNAAKFSEGGLTVNGAAFKGAPAAPAAPAAKKEAAAPAAQAPAATPAPAPAPASKADAKASAEDKKAAAKKEREDKKAAKAAAAEQAKKDKEAKKAEKEAKKAEKAKAAAAKASEAAAAKK